MFSKYRIAAVVATSLAAGAAGAQEISFVLPDRYIGYGMSYLSPGDREVDYGIGFDLSYAQELSSHNWLEGKLFLGILETGSPTVPDFYQNGIGADYLRAFGNQGGGHFFALGGGGLAVNDASPDSEDGTSTYYNLGLGYRGQLWSRWGVRPRVELRYVHDSFAEGTNDVVLGFRLEMAPKREMRVEVEKIVEKEVACVVPPVAMAAPVVTDADGDGVLDGEDACPGTLKGARVDATGCVKEEQKISLPNIEFESGKTVLATGGKDKLEAVVEFLNNQREVQVDVFGHTDSQGKDSYNQNLSEGRAKAVREYLESRGVGGDRMTSKGFGETQPIASNETAEGRAQNRRVELLVRMNAATAGATSAP